MLLYAASLYCKINANNEDLENLLKQSINLWQGHRYNYMELAQLYLKQNRAAEAKELIQNALKNVVKIYSDDFSNDNPDVTDVKEFLGERVKGIY